MSATADISTSDNLLREAEEGRSLWMDAWYRLRKNHMAVFGGLFIILVTILSFAGPYFTKYDHKEQNLENRLKSPSSEHLLVRIIWVAINSRGSCSAAVSPSQWDWRQPWCH